MTEPAVSLKRSLGLPLLILYGVGVTIGAGIYVLIGAAAARAGVYAPLSFLVAAAVAGFTAYSYAELATRFPVSAGEAVYVREGLQSPGLSNLVGFLVVTSGVVSAAAVSIGAAAYLQALFALPIKVLVVLLVAGLGLVAVWGISQSVALAGAFTLVEVGGLVFVVFYAASNTPDLPARLQQLVPPLHGDVFIGIGTASLLAFFAFVGFEDIANVAEEVRDPHKTLPRAIIATLGIAVVLYLMVVAVVVLVVPLDRLSRSAAPLSLVFGAQSKHYSTLFTMIACVATLNGVLVQIIMASRVIYGMAVKNSLPGIFREVNKRTQTPVVATVTIVAIILALALAFPIASLAKLTSMVVLGVFVLVNAALLSLKWRKVGSEHKTFSVPVVVPIMGMLTSLAMLVSGFF